METKTEVVRNAFVCGLLTLVMTLGVLSTFTASVEAAINQQINFQGKLTNPDGTNVTNGTYSIRFRVYNHATNDAANACSANSCKWEETQGSVSVTDGNFQVALGSVTALFPAIDFEIDTLYLGIKVGTDAEMTPRVRLTAAPYAFNSFQVGGRTADGFVYLGEPTAQEESTGNPSIFLNKTGGGNHLQLQSSGVDVFTVANNGSITTTGTYNGNTFTSSGLQFGAASTALIQSAASQSLNITGHGNSTLSTDAGTLTVQGLGVTTLTSAARSSGSTNSSNLVIATGNATGTTSTAGNIQLDVGTSTTSNGSILIGTAARAQTITIGNATGGALRLGQNGGTVQIDGTNFDVSTAGVITLPGAQTKDITTTGTNALTIDTAGAAALNLATASANAVSLGRSGITTTNNGALTVTQLLTGSAGATVSGGAVALTGNAASSFTTSSGALTLTSAAAATWSTGGGNLTLQAGSGTVSLGSSTDLIADSDLAIASGAGGVLSLDGTGGNIDIGAVVANRAVTIGNTNSGTTVTVNVGTGTTAFKVQGSAGAAILSVDNSAADSVAVGAAANGASFKTYLSAGNDVSVTANAAPTTDMVKISNSGQAVTTAGVSGLQITYVGGSAAVEASAARFDLTPGGTTGGTWNGLRIVANATGAASGVTENGLKLEGPSSPGSGTETAIQITTGWDVGVDVGSGGLELTAMSDPATPASGDIRFYARNIAGRTMLKAKGSSGVDYALQPSLFQQSVFLVTPGNAATANSWTAIGGQVTTGGTISMATTSQTQGFMGNVATGTTAGTAAGVSNNTNQYYRGTGGNNADGFFFFARVYFPGAIGEYNNTTSGARFFAGLSSALIVGAGGMGASDNPTGDFVGFQFAPNTDATNIRIISKDNTTLSGASTGVALAVAKTYDLYIYCKPGDTTIYWRIDNLTDGSAPVENSITNNLPRTTIAMKAGVGIAPLNTTADNLRIQRVYVETDR